jgi:hypothetical protein
VRRKAAGKVSDSRVGDTVNRSKATLTVSIIVGKFAKTEQAASICSNFAALRAPAITISRNYSARTLT